MTAEQDAADRADWERWVAAEQDKLQTWEGSGIDEWNHYKIERYRLAGKHVPAFIDHTQGAYAGAWHIVKHWASEEFREYIERHGHPRITWAEWQARARQQRETLASDEQAYRDDVARPLDDLAYWRELDDRRGAMILQARERGASWAEICTASGLSRQQANTLANKHGAAERAAEYAEQPF